MGTIRRPVSDRGKNQTSYQQRAQGVTQQAAGLRPIATVSAHSLLQ